MWFYDTGRDLSPQTGEVLSRISWTLPAGSFLWAVKVSEKWELCQVGIECGNGILTVQTGPAYSNLWGPPWNSAPSWHFLCLLPLLPCLHGIWGRPVGAVWGLVFPLHTHFPVWRVLVTTRSGNVQIQMFSQPSTNVNEEPGPGTWPRQINKTWCRQLRLSCTFISESLLNFFFIQVYSNNNNKNDFFKPANICWEPTYLLRVSCSTQGIFRLPGVLTHGPGESPGLILIPSQVVMDQVTSW